MMVMIACVNFHYCGGVAYQRRLYLAPTTVAQHASHLRRGVAADALIDRCPAEMVLQIWSGELRMTSVSYAGEQVQRCLRTDVGLLKLGLPPRELTGSI